MFFLRIVIFGIIGGCVFIAVMLGYAFLIQGVEAILEYIGFDLDRDQYGKTEFSSYLYDTVFPISGFFGVATFILLFFIGPFFRWILRKKFCAWCGKKSGLTKEKEYEGKYVWEYPNADGSEDKRKKNNFQKANYFTFWRCKKCSALTQFQHNMSRYPSSSVEVITVMLTEDGEGERTSKDWEGKGVHSVSGVR